MSTGAVGQNVMEGSYIRTGSRDVSQFYLYWEEDLLPKSAVNGKIVVSFLCSYVLHELKVQQ